MHTFKISINQNVSEMEFDESATVDQLRSRIAADKGVEPKAVRLICMGAMLNDGKPITDIPQNGTVMVMIRAAPAAAAATPAPAPAPAPAAPAAGFPGLPDLSALGALGGLGGLGNMEDLLNNGIPAPMMDMFMNMMSSNPEALTQMMAANPMFQQMAAENPEIAEILSNPDQLVQAMRAMNDPVARRSVDAALQDVAAEPAAASRVSRLMERMEDMDATGGQDTTPTSQAHTARGSELRNPFAQPAPGAGAGMAGLGALGGMGGMPNLADLASSMNDVQQMIEAAGRTLEHLGWHSANLHRTIVPEAIVQAAGPRAEEAVTAISTQEVQNGLMLIAAGAHELQELGLLEVLGFGALEGLATSLDGISAPTIVEAGPSITQQQIRFLRDLRPGMAGRPAPRPAAPASAAPAPAFGRPAPAAPAASLSGRALPSVAAASPAAAAAAAAEDAPRQRASIEELRGRFAGELQQVRDMGLINTPHDEEKFLRALDVMGGNMNAAVNRLLGE